MSVCFGVGRGTLCRTGCWYPSGVACEALCRYSHVFTIQDRTQTSASVPCGWSFSRGCGIGSGCCGGRAPAPLGLRQSALLCQGLLFEPKASSAPGTMILADSLSLSSIRRRALPEPMSRPRRTFVPPSQRTLLPPCAHSFHAQKDGHPKPRQPPFPHTSYIGNRNIEKYLFINSVNSYYQPEKP